MEGSDSMAMYFIDFWASEFQVAVLHGVLLINLRF